MPITNLTNLTNKETIFGLVEYSNEVTGGNFMWMMVLAFSIIIFISSMSRNYSIDKNITSAAYVNMIVSIILLWTGLIRVFYVITSIVLVFFIVIYLYWTRDK
jgi:heme A synthase